MGLSAKEFSLLFSQAPNRGGKLPTDSLDAQRWWNVSENCCIMACTEFTFWWTVLFLGSRIVFTVFAWLWLMAGADLLRE